MFGTSLRASFGNRLTESNNRFLLEGSSDNLLLEDGSRILLEDIQDMFASNIVLFVTGDGPDESSPAKDFGPSKHVLTHGSDVKIDQGQLKFGIASLRTDGENNVAGEIQINNHNDFHFSNQPFTVQSWVRWSGNKTGTFMSKFSTGGSNREWRFWVDEVNLKLTFDYSTSGSNSFRLESDIPPRLDTNRWYHFAASRDLNNDLRIFFNGKIAGEINIGGATFATRSAPFRIFRFGAGEGQGLGNSTTAWQDEILIHKGVAVYTENFAPRSVAHLMGRLQFEGTISNLVTEDGLNVIELESS